MRIVVFGAGGMIGSRVVAEALSRGHEVTGVTRSGTDGGRAGCTAVAADALDPGAVAQVAAGHDVAVTATKSADRIGDLVAALLDGLARAGVPRLIQVGGAGSLLLPDGSRLVDSPDFPAEWHDEAAAMADALEDYRAAETPVDWSYVSPAPIIQPGERTGVFRVGGDEVPAGAGDGPASVSAEDFAVAILDEAETPAHVRVRFNVAN